MSNELIISATQNGCRIALLRDRSLAEFHQDEGPRKFIVGDIYVGVVKKVVPGLNAAFVDIGHQKDAFLHYLDLGPQFSSFQKFVKLIRARRITGGKLNTFKLEKDIDKHGKMARQLSQNQLVVVQVAKEPISTKGPRLSCEVSIAGRYLVLVPFSSTVSVSKKIASSQERKRLLRLIKSIKPENFGVIIRTVAEGKEVAQLDRDLQGLFKIWEEGIARLATARPREKVIGELDKTSSILRDVLNESFDKIHIDQKNTYEEIKTYIQTIAPEKAGIVKLYSGRKKIFEQYGIERQIKSAFGQTVTLRGGGYLIIEHTEALHVIDVNSGSNAKRADDQEATALTVNLDAATEIARQLRLRDMGGIIVIDFIDMRKVESKRALLDKMKAEMGEHDRAKHTILPLSRFGLMQITRERVRPQMDISTKEKCPACNGSGKISAAVLVSDTIEGNVEHLLTRQEEKSLTLALHPYLYVYFTAGIFSKRIKWFFRYKKWVNLVQDSSLPLTECVYLNGNGEEIELDPGA